MSSIFNHKINESKLFTENQLVTLLQVKYCSKYSTIMRTVLSLYFPLLPAFLFLLIFITSPSRISLRDKTGIMWKYKPTSCYSYVSVNLQQGAACFSFVYADNCNFKIKYRAQSVQKYFGRICVQSPQQGRAICDTILSFVGLRISQVSLLASTGGGTAPV